MSSENFMPQIKTTNELSFTRLISLTITLSSREALVTEVFEPPEHFEEGIERMFLSLLNDDHQVSLEERND